MRVERAGDLLAKAKSVMRPTKPGFEYGPYDIPLVQWDLTDLQNRIAVVYNTHNSFGACYADEHIQIFYRNFRKSFVKYYGEQSVPSMTGIIMSVIQRINEEKKNAGQ